ncbi:hypothetical protein D3C81_1253390 [compost metagenome]
MDVDGAVAVTKHLQDVFQVLQLFTDDRFEQRREYCPGHHFSGDLRLIEADKAVTLLQAQEAVDFVLVTAGFELTQQGVFQVLVICQHLQPLSRGVEVGVGVADHQRPRQFYVIGLVFPQSHGLQRWAAGRAGSRLNQCVQGGALLRSDDFGFALEHNICPRLFANGSGEKLATRRTVGAAATPKALDLP